MILPQEWNGDDGPLPKLKNLARPSPLNEAVFVPTYIRISDTCIRIARCSIYSFVVGVISFRCVVACTERQLDNWRE